MGVRLSYFQNLAIFLAPFLYVCKENISVLKQNVSKAHQFLKRIKCPFLVLNMFYQSHLTLIFLQIIESWRYIVDTEIYSKIF